MPLARTSTNATLNYDAILDLILGSGESAVDEAVEEMMHRAKKHAPVRDIFLQNQQRPPERVPRGIQRRRRYKHQYKVFGRRILHHTPAGQDRFLSQVKAQTQRSRRVYFGIGKRQRLEGNARQFSTRTGSQQEPGPLLPGRDDEGRLTGDYVQGNFRKTQIFGGRARLAGVRVRQQDNTRAVLTGDRFISRFGRGELRRVNQLLGQARAAKVSDDEIRRIAKASSISQRRRAEEGNPAFTKAQRAFRRTALHVNADNEVTLGGRLRDEIYRTKVTREGTKIYADVVSPTEYGKYQEYGTSHHRAQPYMRPALYEMRERFLLITKRALRQRRSV